mmetsp:Transcript_6644/g.17991  ORF Transcript_6644/g.17991 Transcript_6644/m.17991 type:complete len:363 (+) Transcript_6644:768-1856(+)
MVLSALPVTKWCPSGTQATAVTASVCLAYVCEHSPVATSHRFTSVSMPQVSKCESSGAHATPVTPSAWPASTRKTHGAPAPSAPALRLLPSALLEAAPGHTSMAPEPAKPPRLLPVPSPPALAGLLPVRTTPLACRGTASTRCPTDQMMAWQSLDADASRAPLCEKASVQTSSTWRSRTWTVSVGSAAPWGSLSSKRFHRGRFSAPELGSRESLRAWPGRVAPCAATAWSSSVSSLLSGTSTEGGMRACRSWSKRLRAAMRAAWAFGPTSQPQRARRSSSREHMRQAASAWTLSACCPSAGTSSDRRQSSAPLTHWSCTSSRNFCSRMRPFTWATASGEFRSRAGMRSAAASHWPPSTDSRN